MNTLALPDGSKLEERLAHVAMWSVACVVTAIFAWIVGDVLVNGFPG